MKQYFLYTIAALIPLAIGGWFLYALGKALYGMYEDWKLGKELDELQTHAESRREQERLKNEQRLNNGCEHRFDNHVFGLPPDTCGKCGLQRRKPEDPCDHVWKLETGPVPCSTCQRCGKKYNPTQEREQTV
jgi:hypothetical protein